jgi:hypothetical protein
MGTYALIDDVQARLAGRPAFGSDTKPSQAQVETWIDEAEAFVAAAVGAAGIGMPSAGEAGVKLVRSWVCDYAEGHVRMAHAVDVGNEDGRDLVVSFRELLVNIRRYPGEYGAMLAGGSSGGGTKIRGTNTDTTADDYIAPEFERGEVW